MKKTLKVFTKKGDVTLTHRDYIAEGGEGAVFRKGGLAYKIYHDSSKMIPVAKIKELQGIKKENVTNSYIYKMKTIFWYLSNLGCVDSGRLLSRMIFLYILSCIVQ